MSDTTIMSAPTLPASSLIHLLEARADTHGDARLYTFLVEDEGDETALSYQELWWRARRIAALLQDMEARGKQVVLLYPPGLEYISGFLGCSYAGAVAVPAYPPDPARLERTLPRLRAIIQDAQTTVVLTASRRRTSGRCTGWRRTGFPGASKMLGDDRTWGRTRWLSSSTPPFDGHAQGRDA